MDTIIAVLDNTAADEALIRRAGEILREGGLVAFPTETVYGLGGDALNPASSRKIYAAKGRPSDNPLIVHITRWEDVGRIAWDGSGMAGRLAEAFWPGPLTMILHKKDIVPYETTGGLDTVAIRCPSHPVAAALIEAAGGYVAAPSANLSGRPSPTTPRYVIEDLNGRVDMILDGGEVGIGLESTIVDLTEPEPMVLRPGYITQAMLAEVIGAVRMDPGLMSSDARTRPKAPGMRYRHYAPKGDLAIVEGEPAAVVLAINRLCAQASAAGEVTGVIATKETMQYYQADVVKCVGAREDEEAVAHNLYRILREFDDEGTQIMYSESFSTEGVGAAIMNRLLKAAGHRVITAAEVT